MVPMSCSIRAIAIGLSSGSNRAVDLGRWTVLSMDSLFPTDLPLISGVRLLRSPAF